MTNSQLTVSAIRQHFESTSYFETTDTSNIRLKHVMPSKSESESQSQKKQPPKTRPKPKTSVVMAAQSDYAESAGNIARPSQSVVNDVAHHELEPSHNANDESADTDDVPLGSFINTSNSSHAPACDNTETASSHLLEQPSASNLAFDDPIQTTRVLAKRVSRDENDVVRPLVKQTVMNRWASTSSLQSDATVLSTGDVKEAIKNAKRKLVLHRIVGMKLEGENLPQQGYETASDHCKVASDSGVVDVKEHSQTNERQVDVVHDTPTSLPAADDEKPFAVSTDDDASTSRPTDHQSTSADVTSEPNLLSVALVQNVMTERSSPVPIMLSTDETTTENEEESGSDEIKSASVDKTRRPISLYPQDLQQLLPIETHSPLSVIDVHSPVSADALSNDNWTETSQPDRQASLPRLPNGQKQSPITENTANVSPVKHTQVATSRKSFLILKEFVGDNFSFLDDFDDTAETEQRQVGSIYSDDAEVQQRVDALGCSGPTSSVDEAISAATPEHCTQDSGVKTEEQSTELTRENERPKSLLRKSIVLPNGKILEIIGNAFTFLDDYDEQIVDEDSWL